MRIIHVSDNHSAFYPLGAEDADIVIHTGDLCPNLPWQCKAEEDIRYQRAWVSKNIERFKHWLKDKPFVFVQGNHDRCDFSDILVANGIDAVDITNKFHSYNNVLFYGFPFVNPINGYWSHEKAFPEMTNEIDRMLDKFAENRVPDVLCAHAPIAGLLDSDHNGSFGNAAMLNAILYKMKVLPKLYLCGHVHAPNKATFNDMKISNAATTAHLIEI